MSLEKLMSGVDLDHMSQNLKQGDEIYMLCPVRKATPEEKEFLEAYKQEMTKRGFNAHYPATDTNQESDRGGYRICVDHCDEIDRAAQVHVYWNEKSTGSFVDLGSALLLHRKFGKKIKLMNPDYVKEMVADYENKGITKRYEHVLLELDRLARSS